MSRQLVDQVGYALPQYPDIGFLIARQTLYPGLDSLRQASAADRMLVVEFEWSFAAKVFRTALKSFMLRKPALHVERNTRVNTTVAAPDEVDTERSVISCG